MHVGHHKLHGAREIEKSPYDAIQPVHFLRDEFDLRLGLWKVAAGERLKVVEPNRNRVQRVLDLVRDAAGNTAHRIQARGRSEFRFEVLPSGGIADSGRQILDVEHGDQLR